jgi:prolyl-tRNA editing enzyme YbaK/EbsC (Cys-tRNA(Pro) deacylase)
VPDEPVHPSIQRVLDAALRKGVTLEVTRFAESTHTAAEAASAVGAELGQIVKSIVFVVPSGDGAEPLLCLVAGPNRVDLARLAAVAGESDVRRATAREAHELTGFSIGGIPPIGHSRPVRVIMDPDLGRYPVVWAAAGLPTAVFPVPPGTLRVLANATVAPITEVQPVADRESASVVPAGGREPLGPDAAGGDGTNGRGAAGPSHAHS